MTFTVLIKLFVYGKLQVNSYNDRRKSTGWVDLVVLLFEGLPIPIPGRSLRHDVVPAALPNIQDGQNNDL